MDKSPSAIVTGASTGLGLEIALHLAKTTHIVIGIARHAPADARWKELEATGRVQFVVGDVSNPDIVQQSISAANALGNYNLLINCAGQGVFGPATAYTRDDISTVLAGNLVGLILFCTNSLETFLSKGGTIVNVMSTASHVGRGNETIYCASKWGARGYTEALRVELKGKPIRILAVYPGGMRTPFWSKAKGHNVNSDKFMDALEVAEEISMAITEKRSIQVTDIVINRS